MPVQVPERVAQVWVQQVRERCPVVGGYTFFELSKNIQKGYFLDTFYKSFSMNSL